MDRGTAMLQTCRDSRAREEQVEQKERERERQTAKQARRQTDRRRGQTGGLGPTIRQADEPGSCKQKGV